MDRTATSAAPAQAPEEGANAPVRGWRRLRRELGWGGPAFGFTIWMLGTLVDFTLLIFVSWWRASEGGPAGLASGVGFVAGLFYAMWRNG